MYTPLYNHGSRHDLYSIYHGMKSRCYNKNNESYKNYGARGITVCKRWRCSFQVFVSDMGIRPRNHSIDRINNDGNYTPENCKWSTRTEQNRNTRNKTYHEAFGESKTILEWSEDLRIDNTLNIGCIRSRISNGWSMEKALITPLIKNIYK